CHHVAAFFAARQAHLFDSISKLECSFFFHCNSFDRLLFSSAKTVRTLREPAAFYYRPRRGLNDLTAVRRPGAAVTNGFAAFANGRAPPKPSGATRFTGWPVSRSIARRGNSSTGATMVIA